MRGFQVFKSQQLVLAYIVTVLVLSVVGIATDFGGATAQEATLNSSVSRTSITKVKIDTFHFDRNGLSVVIGLVYQDSGNADVPAPGLTTSFTIPSAAGVPCTSATTLGGLAGAMNAVRASETGTEPRKQQFRILGYLADQGCLTGVTLVP
jgi:hypothetical protein